MKMKNGGSVALMAAGCVVLVLAAGIWLIRSGPPDLSGAAAAGRKPEIYPDYRGIVIPPNIAPLNFSIREPGRRFHARFGNGKADGAGFAVRGKSSSIVIPPGKWKRLLDECRGRKLRVEICVQGNDGGWRRFLPFEQKVAREEMDPYMAYRKMGPLYAFWRDLAICQRDIGSYDESVIAHNRTLVKKSRACLNCHAFCNNQPDKMLLHLRGGPGTCMLLARDGKVARVDTKTGYGAGSYRDWHPGGKLVALACIKVTQFFHAKGENRDVFDYASDIVLYDTETNTVTTCEKIASAKRLETYPAWSPCGRWLYFCCLFKKETPAWSFKEIRESQYDLMRISFDPETGRWGEVETVLSSAETGLSIAHPAVSPDGRHLLFCMCEYGNFTTYRPGSDLYLLDLNTRQYRRLDEINSPRSDSYHCWSSNGRWIVFASKREDGLLAKPYFSYFNGEDKFAKPFVLPQENPEMYHSYLKTFNVPVFMTGPVPYSPRQFTDAAFGRGEVREARLDPAAPPDNILETAPAPWTPAAK